MTRPTTVGLIASLALLAACGTPQEQCINRNTRDLRVVNRLIAESEANLRRGYALEEVTVFEPVQVPCRSAVTTRPVGGGYCYDREPDTELRPRAIDLGAEAAKLDSLRAKSASLSRDADRVALACQRAYPE